MPKVHAPDGGQIVGSLCEEPTGDVAYRERDVTCTDCLDAIDNADQTLMRRLLRSGWTPISRSE